MLYIHEEADKMKRFESFQGKVTDINDFYTDARGTDSGCSRIYTIKNGDGSIVNFVVTPSTYFVDGTVVSLGDTVTGFYDTTVPAIMIYPPQYRAVVMAKETPMRNVELDYFDRDLVNSDNTLKLNIGPRTATTLENGQPFTRDPANRYLAVVYGPVTRSIPAQTTPYQIIVLCGHNG